MASYTAQQRNAARALYESRGAKVASQELGIPRRTINDWAAKEGWAQRLAAVSSGEAHSRAIKLGWAARRQGLADDAAHTASRILELLNGQLDRGKVYGVMDLARAFGILVERAAEMSAGAGGEEGELPAPEAARRLDLLLDAAEQGEAAGG
jgi:hypothetical protein